MGLGPQHAQIYGVGADQIGSELSFPALLKAPALVHDAMISCWPSRLGLRQSCILSYKWLSCYTTCINQRPSISIQQKQLLSRLTCRLQWRRLCSRSAR